MTIAFRNFTPRILQFQKIQAFSLPKFLLMSSCHCPAKTFNKNKSQSCTLSIEDFSRLETQPELQNPQMQILIFCNFIHVCWIISA